MSERSFDALAAEAVARGLAVRLVHSPDIARMWCAHVEAPNGDRVSVPDPSPTRALADALAALDDVKADLPSDPGERFLELHRRFLALNDECNRLDALEAEAGE